MKKNINLKKLIIPIILIVCISLYPVIFMYCKNVAETDFKEVFGLVLGYPMIGLLMWCACVFAFREIYKGTLLAFVFIAFISNYMLLQNLIVHFIPRLKYWHVLPLGIVIVLHIAYLIKKKLKEESIKDIVGILALVMGALLIINYVPAVPKIIEKSQNENQSIEGDMAASGNQPNIYWMIFDECASFPVIEKYYHDTDKNVYNYLQDVGFFISDTSRNESGNTHAVLTNCINLEYVVNSDMDYAQMDEYHQNPKLYSILQENGYSVRGIGDTEWLGGVKSVNADGGAGAQTVEGLGVKELILQNSVIGPFVQYSGTESAELILNSFKYMQNDDNFVPGSSQFNLLYLCAPHQPFLFDENGNDVMAINYNNWEDDKYYFGQYKFVMKEIKKTVESILQNDPDSIIIIESDHGPRFKEEIPFEDKINVLNAVYYRGEDISEIDGKSNVNTLRTVLNRLFGTTMEDLEVKDGE